MNIIVEKYGGDNISPLFPRIIIFHLLLPEKKDKFQQNAHLSLIEHVGFS